MDEETRQETGASQQPAAQEAATATSGTEAGRAADGSQQADAKKTYDDAYIAQMRADFEKQRQEAVEEALKKDNMSDEDKAKYEADQRQKDIEKREKEIALRELKADAKGMLAKEKLSDSFVDMVVGADAEATQQNVKALKAAIDAEVQLQVEARLKGKAPKTGSGDSSRNDTTSDMEAQMNAIMGL